MNEIQQNKVYSIFKDGRFASNLDLARQNGLEIASLRDYAKYLGDYTPRKTEISRLPAGFTREGILYVPQTAILMIRNSPLIESSNAERLTYQVLENKGKYQEIRRKACKEGRGKDLSNIQMEEEHFPFYLDAIKYLEIARKEKDLQVEERNVLVLKPEYMGSDGRLEIPFNKLEEAEVFRWALRDYAKPHADYLRSVCLNSHKSLFGELGTNFRDEFKKPHIRQFWYSPSESGEFGIKGNQKYSYGKVLAIKRDKTK